MSEGFKPLSEGADALFASLERRVQTTLDLTARVRATLTGLEKEHVISASYQDETVIVYTDSGAWCAQVRYAESALLAALNAGSEMQVTKLKVRVART
jgi:hypothetical protein